MPYYIPFLCGSGDDDDGGSLANEKPGYWFIDFAFATVFFIFRLFVFFQSWKYWSGVLSTQLPVVVVVVGSAILFFFILAYMSQHCLSHNHIYQNARQLQIISHWWTEIALTWLWRGGSFCFDLCREFSGYPEKFNKFPDLFADWILAGARSQSLSPFV